MAETLAISGGTIADKRPKLVKLNSSHRVYGLGIILLAALTACSHQFHNLGAPSFLISLGVGAAAYLLAVREFFVTPQFPRRVIVFGLVLAAVWHVLFLRLPPSADDDIHRYLWDGRVQRLGYNPYIVIPNDPALGELHTAETRTLNHPELPTLYPPGAELFFRGVTAIHESVFSLKLALILCDWLIVLVLFGIFRETGAGRHWVLAYAWNPLLAIEVAGNGHIDILGVLLLLISFAALLYRWRVIAALSFGLAVAVKFLPIVLLPLYWRRLRVRDALLAAVACGLLYVPFLNHGRIPTGSLGTYMQSFRFNDPIFAVLERITTPQVGIGLAVLAGLLASIWMASKSRELTTEAFAWPMAASLLCGPVVYPWYLLWLLPFLRSFSTLPLLIWTLSILPTYYVWHLRALGQLWILPGWVTLIEYGSVAGVGVVTAWLSMKRSQSPAITDRR